jgi:hypothetical protein
MMPEMIASWGQLVPASWCQLVPASWCLPAACQNASRDALAAKMQDALIGFGLEVMSALVGTPNLTSGPK